MNLIYDRDVMSQKFGMSIAETAQLVGCSRSAAVYFYENRINGGETRYKCQCIQRPRVDKGKGYWRLLRMEKQNHYQAVAQLAM